MARDVDNLTPVTSRDELVAWIAQGECAPDAVALGTEHEKILYRLADHAPVIYDPPDGRGIRAVLQRLEAATGWTPLMEGAHVIGLHDDATGASVSLEPGGQLELSGAALDSVHAVAAELDHHLAQVQAIAAELGLGVISLGMSPTWTRDQVPHMPKKRYDIMHCYMPHVGGLGLDMMHRTATVQTNVDFTSEADMVTKLRVSLALQPLVTALFASSPFTDGVPNGYLSMRSHIWTDTDADRTGMLPFAFEDGMGYERYVDWALDVPMYFVKRGQTYHDVAGASFRDLMAGRLEALPGVTATVADWENHLSTLFPEVRLKRILEMRGADAGSRAMTEALPALVAGLLYHRPSLEAAGQVVGEWTAAERQALRDDVPRLALHATVHGRRLQDVAREVLDLSRQGLAARNRLDDAGQDETVYLAPLDQIVETGRTRAEDLLDRYRGEWGGRADAIFTECAL